MRFRILTLSLLAVVLAALAGCGPSPAAAPTAVVVTKTPRPTFTPTTVPPTATRLVPSATPLPTATSVPATATAAPPTAVPTAATAMLTANDTANVRSGPGTAFGRIGQLTQGQQFQITGKNPDGDWWQFDFNGTPAWIAASMVSVNDAAAAVAVAADLPAPPVAAPAQPVVQQPAQPAAPQPAAPPPAPATRFGNAGLETRDADNTNFTIVTFWGRLGSTIAAPPGDAANYKLRVSAPSGSVEVPFRTTWENAYSGQRQMEFRYNAKGELARAGGGFRAVIIDGGGKEVSDVISGNLTDRTHDVILSWMPR